MLWLYRIFCGEVTVIFSGVSPERMLNIAAVNRIRLRCVSLNKSGICALMPIKSFKRLRPFVRGTGVRVHITKKRGLPFILRKYRARSGFLLGLVIFFALLKLLSGFIWTVNVSGNSRVDDDEILAACRKVGVYEGVRASTIDTTGGAQKMLISMPELAWASFNIENCVLTVNVTEIKKTDRDKSGVPMNLRATADGVITGIDVTAGNVLVKIGDVVSKGDLLVSGVIDSMNSAVFVRSQGTVTAKTERTFTATGTFTTSEQKPTGKTVKRAVLEVFGIRLPLYIGKVEPPYNSEVEVKRAYMFKNKLPLGLTIKSFELTEEKEKRHSYDELLGILKKDIKRQTEKMNLENCEIRSENVTENADGLTLESVIISDEKISQEDLILFDTIN